MPNYRDHSLVHIHGDLIWCPWHDQNHAPIACSAWPPELWWRPGKYPCWCHSCFLQTLVWMHPWVWEIYLSFHHSQVMIFPMNQTETGQEKWRYKYILLNIILVCSMLGYSCCTSHTVFSQMASKGKGTLFIGGGGGRMGWGFRGEGHQWNFGVMGEGQGL